MRLIFWGKITNTSQYWEIFDPIAWSVIHLQPLTLNLFFLFTLAPAVIRTILEERKVLVKLRHPFICNLNYAFQDDAFYCLILDFVDSGDLRYHLDKYTFTEDTVRHWIAELSCAVDYLHEHNIVHRDIKPENILINSKGHVCLADFNIARELTCKRPVISGVSGTFNYLAPEIHRGLIYTELVDWWALGVVFYECIYKRLPFRVRHRPEILKAIAAGLKFPETDPPVSPPCKTAISGFLQMFPLQRVQSCNQIFSLPFFQGFDRETLEAAPYIMGSVEGTSEIHHINKSKIPKSLGRTKGVKDSKPTTRTHTPTNRSIISLEETHSQRKSRVLSEAYPNAVNFKFLEDISTLPVPPVYEIAYHPDFKSDKKFKSNAVICSISREEMKGEYQKWYSQQIQLKIEKQRRMKEMAARKEKQQKARQRHHMLQVQRMAAEAESRQYNINISSGSDARREPWKRFSVGGESLPSSKNNSPGVVKSNRKEVKKYNTEITNNNPKPRPISRIVNGATPLLDKLDNHANFGINQKVAEYTKHQREISADAASQTQAQNHVSLRDSNDYKRSLNTNNKFDNLGNGPIVGIRRAVNLDKKIQEESKSPAARMGTNNRVGQPEGSGKTLYKIQQNNSLAFIPLSLNNGIHRLPRHHEVRRVDGKEAHIKLGEEYLGKRVEAKIEDRAEAEYQSNLNGIPLQNPLINDNAQKMRKLFISEKTSSQQHEPAVDRERQCKNQHHNHHFRSNNKAKFSRHIKDPKKETKDSKIGQLVSKIKPSKENIKSTKSGITNTLSKLSAGRALVVSLVMMKKNAELKRNSRQRERDVELKLKNHRQAPCPVTQQCHNQQHFGSAASKVGCDLIASGNSSRKDTSAGALTYNPASTPRTTLHDKLKTTFDGNSRKDIAQQIKGDNVASGSTSALVIPQKSGPSTSKPESKYLRDVSPICNLSLRPFQLRHLRHYEPIAREEENKGNYIDRRLIEAIIQACLPSGSGSAVSSIQLPVCEHSELAIAKVLPQSLKNKLEIQRLFEDFDCQIPRQCQCVSNLCALNWNSKDLEARALEIVNRWEELGRQRMEDDIYGSFHDASDNVDVSFDDELDADDYDGLSNEVITIGEHPSDYGSSSGNNSSGTDGSQTSRQSNRSSKLHSTSGRGQSLLMSHSELSTTRHNQHSHRIGSDCGSSSRSKDGNCNIGGIKAAAQMLNKLQATNERRYSKAMKSYGLYNYQGTSMPHFERMPIQELRKAYTDMTGLPMGVLGKSNSGRVITS